MDSNSETTHTNSGFNHAMVPGHMFANKLERIQFLSDISLQMLQGRRPEELVENIVKYSVPRIADIAAIYIQDSDRNLVLSNVVHREASKSDLVWNFDRRFKPGVKDQSSFLSLFKKQLPTIVARKDLDTLLDYHPIIQELGLISIIHIPFGNEKSICGSLLLSTTHFSRREYHDSDKDFLYDLEQRFTLALTHVSSSKNYLHDYNEIINGLDAVVWESDASRSFYYYISEPAQHLTGYPVKKWLNEENVWQQIIHPADRERVLSSFYNCIQHKDNLDFEYRIVTANGKTEWIRDLLYVVRDLTGQPSRVRGIILNVTGSHKTADALMKSESALHLFAQSVEDYAIIMLDQHGLITNWNIAAEKITSYSAKEVIGKPMKMLFTSEEIERGVPEQEIQGALSGRSSEDNRWHIRKDGSRFWASGVLTALRDERGELLGFVKLARDMTVQKFKEEELQRAKEAAEVANEAKGQFLAIMSHELRTPLGAMIGFADALLDVDLPERKRLEYAETIRSSGQRLSTLIDDILDLTKVESGRLEIECHTFSIVELTKEINALLRIRAEEKNLKFEIKVDGQIPSAINSDPSRLRQILINIIGNAIKFTCTGAIELILKYEKLEPADQSKLYFIVKDSGPGIPTNVQTQLFQPFIQADSSISRRFGGTGLGLALSRRLARALGGDVKLESSTIGEGSCFVISVNTGANGVPMISEIEWNSLNSVPRSTIPKNSPLKGMKALVVDDAPENRLLIGHILKKGGCSKVDTANDGDAGLKAAMGGGYDVIIMDMQMPVMDGFDATAALRRQGYERPIIALTAHAMPEERLKCLAAGCDDFLIKPIQTAKLFEAILRFTPLA
jgi:PAS domain S-box-containing protein